ncbi:hypothetical protein F511_09121 [Dorcoceras hygrometricum]|uniref:Dystroglycan-like n=1 Tax=Dorcoceras hygrometricum TaxID=472368 RepID=A0A2Z7CCQ5_9LAMI|nr:hypothetical protein F511_09121 [Dorcoceras hygrometricum]
MASFLFFNNVHVCFESVLAMDNAGMVAMFESLVDTGLKGFLGCPAVIHKAALLEFFENGSVRDGLVVSTVNGVTVEISEQLFAETFELPVEGLTDLSEIPKDLVFDERSIVSLSGEPAGSFDAITQEKFLMMAVITCGVRINWNRLLFKILKDMVTPGSRQAKGYAIQISLLLENVPNLELGESSEFPSSKVLTEKTVHRYIVLNDKVGMEDVTAEPRVKKTPTKKAASKKRPATDAAVAPVVKKKPTTKSKTGSSKENLETLPVEAVPLQMIAPTPVAPAEQPPVPKRKTQKRKRRLILGYDDEIVDIETVVGGSIVGEAAVEVVDDTAEKDVETVVESVGISEAETVVDSVIVETVVESVDEPVSFPAVADVLNEGISTADDVDVIIERVISETAQLETDEGEHVDEPDVSRATAEDQVVEKADEVERWIDIPYEVLFARDTEQMVTTSSDTDEAFIADQVFGIGVEEMETEDVEQSADEAMSLEDILMTIPAECPLPSAYVEITKIILGKTISIPGVNEGDWYKASIPKIPAVDKGKEPLLERDHVKGNPIKEQFSLILADIEVLLMLREKIIEDVDRFFNSFRLKRLATLKIDESYFDKEALILSWAETDSTRIALNRRTYILTKDLKEQTMAHGLKWEKTCCSKIFEGRPRDRGAIISKTNTNTCSTCWIRTMIRVDGVWVIEPCGDHWVKIPREVVNNEISRQRSYEDTVPPTNNALGEVMNKIDHVKSFFLDSIAEQNETFRGLFKRSLLEAQTDNNALSLALKAVRNQNVILSTDLEATRKEVRDMKASLSKDFDDKLADIRNELLEFHVET